MMRSAYHARSKEWRRWVKDVFDKPQQKVEARREITPAESKANWHALAAAMKG